jgi:hypothetical protein
MARTEHARHLQVLTARYQQHRARLGHSWAELSRSLAVPWTFPPVLTLVHRSVVGVCTLPTVCLAPSADRVARCATGKKMRICRFLEPGVCLYVD